LSGDRPNLGLSGRKADAKDSNVARPRLRRLASFFKKLVANDRGAQPARGDTA
jgi:hypothetical protein